MTGAILRRFSIGPLKFLRRPLSEVPPDGTLGAVDNGDAFGWTNRSAAMFKDGEWANARGKPLSFQPTYWTILDPGPPDVG